MSLLRSENRKKIMSFIILSVFLIIGTGCGGGGGGTSEVDNPDLALQGSSATWEVTAIKTLSDDETGGLMTPRVCAKPSSNGTIHLVYFVNNPNESSARSIKYISFDSDDIGTPLDVEEETVLEVLDNNVGLSLAMDGNNPVVSYRGGEVRSGGQPLQSDVMINVRNGNNDWVEFLGAYGKVSRSGFFDDGLAGADLSLTISEQGQFFLNYQFYYEGIDETNAASPDLLCSTNNIDSLEYHSWDEYVAENGSDVGGEEVGVEGVDESVYSEEGGIYSASILNDAGGLCQTIIDNDGNPVVFYSATLDIDDPTNKEGLRVARRNSEGVWTAEWVEEDVEIEYISPAIKTNGQLGVAYAVKNYEVDRDLTIDYGLKYAENFNISGSSQWDTAQVGKITTNCGRFCTLAYDENDFPLIAYFDEVSVTGTFINELVLTRKNANGSWSSDTVASRNTLGIATTDTSSAPGQSLFYIGKYNSMWIYNSKLFICSYSNMTKTIYLFVKNL